MKKTGIPMDPAVPSTVTMEFLPGKTWTMLCTVCLGVVDAYDIYLELFGYMIYIYIIYIYI